MKSILKRALRLYTLNVPLRGRHKLADKLGGKLDNSVELFEMNGFKIEIDHAELFCRHIYYGVYEIGLINFLKSNIKEGDIVFDPGTNLGYITATCLGLVGNSGHIYSFEPSKTCFEKLAQNNDLDKFTNLSLLNAAISRETDEATFYDTPRVISRGYACLEDAATPEDGTPYTINVYGIDGFCGKNGIEKIKFLKLDIEGSELPALRGSSNLLENKAIDYILVETAIDADIEKHVSTNKQINELLSARDHKPYRIHRNGKLYPVDLNNLTKFREDIIWTFKKVAA